MDKDYTSILFFCFFDIFFNINIASNINININNIIVFNISITIIININNDNIVNIISDIVNVCKNDISIKKGFLYGTLELSG